MIRSLLRVLLGNISTLTDPGFNFDKLTAVDKMMALQVIKFSVQVTQAFDQLDLKQVQELI